MRSLRRPSAHAGSISGANVFRSLRSRRMLTRAWCTPVSPASSRTTGSWASSRCTEAAMAAAHDERHRRVLAEAGNGRVGRARGPADRALARASASVSGSPAPAARRWSTTRGIRAGGAPGTTSTSTSRKRAAMRSSSSTETSSSHTSPRSRPPPSRSSTRCRRVTRRATGARVPWRSTPRSTARTGAGISSGPASTLTSVRSSPPEPGTGTLAVQRPRRPTLAGPVADREAGPDEPQVRRVVVGGRQLPVGAGHGPHPGGDAVEVGEAEAGPGAELHLVLDRGRALSHARARASTAGGRARTCAAARRSPPPWAPSATPRRDRAPTPARRRRG